MWGSIIGSVLPGLVGGLLDRRSAREQVASTAGMNTTQRLWHVADIRGARLYEQREKARDRAYSEGQTAKDRLYAARVLQDERRYAAGVTRNNRAYDRAQLASDRAYTEGRLADDRAYMADQRDADIAQYTSDRNRMQNRSNQLAEKTAASRGIDFKKMRDDAVAAGYNPMTALNMAHAYSTQVDYQLQGGVYSPGASYTAAGPGYAVNSGGGGGAAVAGGGAMPMSGGGASQGVAAGGFGTAGGGYQSQFNPALSAGGFVKEAMERGIDTYFNSKQETADPQAEALGQMVAAQQEAQQMQEDQIPKSFGYELTREKPFKAALSVGVPPLRSDTDIQLSGSDDMVNPSQLPLKVYGKDFKPASGMSDAEAFESRYGEIAGEAAGLGALVYDGSSAVRNHAVNRATTKRAKTLRDNYNPPVKKGSGEYLERGVTGGGRKMLKRWWDSVNF